MSSRIHYAKDADAALMYAPLPMRDQAESGRRIDGTRGALGGDHALMQLRRRRTFNSDKAPELPTDAPRSMPRALRLCGVGGAAALVVWAMVTVLETRKAAEPTVSASIALARSSAVDSADNIAAAAAQQVPDRLLEANERPPEQAEPATFPLAPAVQAETKQVDAAPISPPQSAPAQAASAAVSLDSDEIDTLVGRGKDFLAHGDFVSARLLLRRAAEAGSASAALMLGGTFDPLVQSQSGAVPDVAQARRWYKRAAELGSNAASNQLDNFVKKGL